MTTGASTRLRVSPFSTAFSDAFEYLWLDDDAILQGLGLDLYGEPKRTRYPEALPVIRVTAPVGPVVPDNPSTVRWTFTHPDNDPQAEWRVLLVGPAPSMEAIDSSGWVLGDANEWTWDREKVAEAVRDKPDGSQIGVIVEAHTGPHRGYMGMTDSLFYTKFGEPDAVFTKPDPEIRDWTLQKVTAEWLFQDSQQRTQEAYRLRLLVADDQRFDTFWMPGDATSHELDYLVQDGVKYTLGLRVRNDNGIEMSIP